MVKVNGARCYQTLKTHQNATCPGPTTDRIPTKKLQWIIVTGLLLSHSDKSVNTNSKVCRMQFHEDFVHTDMAKHRRFTASHVLKQVICAMQ